jgi:hypothetical protein
MFPANLGNELVEIEDRESSQQHCSDFTVSAYWLARKLNGRGHGH